MLAVFFVSCLTVGPVICIECLRRLIVMAYDKSEMEALETQESEK